MSLDHFRQMKRDYEAAIARDGQRAIADEFKKFFEKNPEIEHVRWVQYTPYFNDGDVCEFARHDFEIQLPEVDGLDADEQENYGVDEDGFVSGWCLPHSMKHLAIPLNSLSDAFANTDDLFEAAFGDGVQVTASKDGFEITDYHHD